MCRGVLPALETNVTGKALVLTGAKVSQTEQCTKIIEVDGKQVTVESDLHSLSSHTRGLYDHTMEVEII